MPINSGPTFLPQEIIRIKRDGGSLSVEQIRSFVAGIAQGSISEGQIGAFCMATFLRGMSAEERAALTLAMRDSGTVCDWSGTAIPPTTLVDKHSTGGVGDEKASLLIVPIVAACGVHMPMISARGLGHTGGEIDLLEAIDGYNVAPPLQHFIATVSRTGCGLIGPTPSLAPADAEIFRIRDVTATVESIPLITASVMSKKLATGTRGLVMSVNFGRGAFMSTREQAQQLAESMLEVATGAGIPAVIFLGYMEDVVGDAIGSRPQLHEIADFFRGIRREPRLLEIVLQLSSEVLVMAKIAPSIDEARRLAAHCLEDGTAAAKFSAMVEAFGGPTAFLDRIETLLPAAPFVQPVLAPEAGFIQDVDARRIGLAMVALGAGRTRPGQPLDHNVGLSGMVHIGDCVTAGQPLCTLYARDEASFRSAQDAILAAIIIGPQQTAPTAVFAYRLANNV